MSNAHPPHPDDNSIGARIVARLTYVWLAVLVMSWLVTAVANRDTAMHVNYVSGAWIALSQWATQGNYYPPLEFDGNYGGTRFGPLAIALQAGSQLLFDDPILGPKVLHFFYLMGLMGGIWVLLKPLALQAHIRLLLALTPIVTWIGWSAGLTIRHDALAAALQVWALVAIYRKDGPTAGGVALAALLAGLAVLAKVSGLWGAAACFFYLIYIAPKRLLILIPIGLVTVGAGLLLAEYFSDGGFSENMRSCLFPKGQAVDPMMPERLYTALRSFVYIITNEPMIIVMLLMSVLGFYFGFKHMPHLGIAMVLVVLMSAYLLTKAGVSANHMIDLIALACIGTGLWLAAVRGSNVRPGGLYNLSVYVLLAASLCVIAMPMSLYAGWWRRPADVSEAVADLVGIEPRVTAEQAVLMQFEPGESVVSLNPAVPVLLGREAIVTDPWMLRIYFRNNPQAEAEFIKRIEAREFDAFVFDRNVGPQLMTDSWNFGEPTLQAVRENYELVDIQSFSVFRPKSDDSP